MSTQIKEAIKEGSKFLSLTKQGQNLEKFTKVGALYHSSTDICDAAYGIGKELDQNLGMIDAIEFNSLKEKVVRRINLGELNELLKHATGKSSLIITTFFLLHIINKESIKEFEIKGNLKAGKINGIPYTTFPSFETIAFLGEFSKCSTSISEIIDEDYEGEGRADRMLTAKISYSFPEDTEFFSLREENRSN